MENHTPVLIVAQRGRVRDGLQALLMALPQVNHVDLADDIASALNSERIPVLVLLDTEEHLNGIATAIESIKLQWPGTRCLILVNSVQDQQAARLAGADDVLLKGFSTVRLFESVRELIAQAQPAEI